MKEYKFYMQNVDSKGNPKAGTLKDLEKDFKGLRYKEMSGINIFGKPKNVYTETYSEGEKMKVYMPSEVIHEATKIEMTLLFLGEERNATYAEFNTFLYNGIHEYWDNLRNMKFQFICTEPAKPSEDIVRGIPYIMVKYTLQNLKGKTTINKTK